METELNIQTMRNWLEGAMTTLREGHENAIEELKYLGGWDKNHNRPKVSPPRSAPAHVKNRVVNLTHHFYSLGGKMDILDWNLRQYLVHAEKGEDSLRENGFIKEVV